MMSTYKVQFSDDTREDVMQIVKNFSNDILIDHVDDESVTVTIQSDNADAIYNELLEVIGKQVYARK